MSTEWGEQVLKLDSADAERGQWFSDGNYAMFIHWGLYSHLANRYEGKTYYGIGEWIMNFNMADIPVGEYKTIAADFNPVEFDPEAIAKLAKDAGMKYVVITAKHHDGFAMYHSAVDDFNIVDQTPYGKDPVRLLAEACRAQGLGFGVYYSHVKEWTSPGGGRGLKTHPDGRPATFDDFFHAKSFPQVEELVTNYGPLDLIWFDTPGSIEEKYVDQFVDVVRRHQPNALINSRVGQGRGDYQSLGDMEVPHSNVPGLWETVDTTNDSWGFAWYDHNWKTPKEITRRLISTVARGGTYMLNIGPRGDGSVPEPAAKALRRSGRWIQQYPFVVYGTDASPWGNPLPWGDITVKENRLFLSVFQMPHDRTLNLPGLETAIRTVELIDGENRIPLKVTRTNGWTRITLPTSVEEPLIPVVEVVLEGEPELAAGWTALYDAEQSDEAKLIGVDPVLETTLLADFASASGAEKSKRRWMEKFGEWKHAVQVSNFGESGRATWEVDVFEAGYYQVDLTYRGPGRIVWCVEVHGGDGIQNEQNASHNYQRFPVGWVYFPEAGRHSLHVSAVDDSGREHRAMTDTPGDEQYASRLSGSPGPTPAFQYEAVADHLRQILEGAGVGAVNVTSRNRVAGSTSTSSFTTACNNLATWFYWRYGEWVDNDPELGNYTSVTGTDAVRWAELRGENDTVWDYVVLIGDPYTIETTPGYYTLGVAKIAEEVAKGSGETVLLMPWPASGSASNLDHYKEVVYRTGRTAGVPVAPAGLAWQAAGSPTGATHPSADGAYIAAATLYSRLFGAAF